MLKIIHIFFLLISLSANCHEEAPSYKNVSPIVGWNRYSGDSANSVKEWFRWWKYLRMKQPTIMEWIYGLQLNIYPGNEICRALFVRGIYDPNLVAAVDCILPEGGVFLDAGASMGYVSLIAAKKCEHVFALEPSGRDFTRLTSNIQINNMENRISPYKLAVSDENSEKKMLIACEERNALNTLGTEFSFKGVEKINEEKVETITIDSFVEREEIKRLDLIKLDIEGSELMALYGASETIKKYRPVIILGVKQESLKTCGTNCMELQHFIHKNGYYFYILQEKPSFAFKKINDISNLLVSVVFCFPEDVSPPILPQPEQKTLCDKCLAFFFE
ncbi:MAG: FkbM family methyltransferase [Holosporaceae bacterium]|jgi:FkbM family methyltransferase|nr:FkbM family methyltransferase [Holosporaceae bacterium]